MTHAKNSRPRRGSNSRSVKRSDSNAAPAAGKTGKGSSVFIGTRYGFSASANLKLKILVLIAASFFGLWLSINVLSLVGVWPLLAVPIFVGAWFFYEIGALVSVALAAMLLVQIPQYRQDAIILSIVTFALLALVLGWGQRRQKVAHRRALRSSLTDPLTGIANYGSFMESLEREISRVDRYGGTATLVMFDIDHFKLFNDRFGHEKGNEALKVVASTLKKEKRDSDIVARYGGEEFVILLPEDEQAGAETAMRLKDAVAGVEVPLGGGTSTGVTLSAGVASYPAVAASREELLDRVDQLLYASKRRGRNQVSIASAKKQLAVI
jgi:diguanylate cyclase (GGDEF)-like protein